MPLPQESGADDQQLVRYVLGLVPEDEAERLDQASIEHDDVALRLRIVEHDLVDAYVRRTLAQELRERFESYYLSLPRHRDRVRCAERFLRAVDRVAAREDAGMDGPSASGREPDDDPAPAASVWNPSRFGGRRFWRLSAVAGLLCVVSSSVLFERMRPAVRSSDPPIGHAAPDDQASARDQRQLPAPLPEAAARAAETPFVRVEPPEPPALVLTPQTRSIGSIPVTLVPTRGRLVAFELQIDSDEFPRYRVGLRDPAVNRIVWRSGWIKAGGTAAQASLTVVVPASMLKLQHYSLDLDGRRAGGLTEIVGSYAFHIADR